MTPYEMARAAFMRPLDYLQRPAQSQWNIDAQLGILDWGGVDMTAVGKVVADRDAKRASREFGMTLPELQEIVTLAGTRVKP